MAAAPVNADIDIVNMALLRLGHTTIADFDEETAAARIAKATYLPIRDSMLEAHPWNFAITYDSLAKEASLPTGVFDYDNSYVLPGNCLRVHSVEYQSADAGDEWTVTSDRLLLTNLGSTTIKIKYIRDDAPVGNYSQTFIDALASRLEMDWAEKLAKSAALGERKERSAGESLRLSRSTDGAEGTPRRIESNSWLNSR